MLQIACSEALIRLFRIADMLPKHWGEPVGGGEVGEQLAAKLLSHNSLLLVLSAAGALQQLPPPVLRWRIYSHGACAPALLQNLAIPTYYLLAISWAMVLTCTAPVTS